MKNLIISLMLIFATFGTAAQVIHVSPTGSGSGNNWGDPASLQSAISSATSTSTIWLLQGTYRLSTTLVIPDHVQVFGGFAGTETQVGQRNFATYVTILDAESQFAVVTLGTLSRLSGVTIQNGVANTSARSSGGGVWMGQSSTLEYCYVLNNTAINFGGGIYAESVATIHNCVIADNRAGVDGFAVSGEEVIFSANTVVNNSRLYCGTTELSFSSEVCQHQTTVLTTTTVGTAYHWSSGQTTRSITTPALTTAGITTLIATITKEDFCVITETYNITVKPKPTVSIATGATEVNPGAMGTFTATGTPSGGTFLWNNTAASTTAAITEQMPASGDLQFTVNYTLNGCVADPATATISNSNCVPAVVTVGTTQLTASLSAVCLGDSTLLTLTGGVRNSGTWVLYAGSCGGEEIARSNINSPTFWVKPTAYTTYFLRGEGCGEQTICVSVPITVNPLPMDITGDETTVCRGATMVLNNLTAGGGTWDGGLSGNVFVSGSGSSAVVTGLLVGEATVGFTAINGCKAFYNVEVLATPSAITGDTNLCQGGERAFFATPAGGAWSATGGTSVTIHPISGLVTASTVNTGITTINYTHPTTNCVARQAVRVWTQPAKPSAADHQVCVNQSVALNPGSPAGGTWTISPTTIAQFNSTYDQINGLAIGTAVVRYQLNAHCSDTFHIAVKPPVTSLMHATTICQGETSQATGVPDGGTFSSSNPAVATVNPTTGQFAGVSPGTFTLTYTNTSGCSRTSIDITVNPTPDPIIGSSGVGVGLTTQLISSAGSGTWTSSNDLVASVGALNGIVTGESVGTATIRFTYLGGCHVEFPITVQSCAFLAHAGGQVTQTVCLNEPIQTISYSLIGATTTDIEWTNQSGESVSQPTGLIFDGTTHSISGTPSVSGIFNFAVFSVDHISVCPAVRTEGAIIVREAVSAGAIAGSSPTTICSGQTPGEFTSITYGSGGAYATATYQWQISTDNGATFGNIAGANSATFQAGALFATTQYRRLYNNTCGTANYPSNVITVTVNPLPATPTAATVVPNSDCLGTNPNGAITIAAQTGVTYSIDGLNFGTNREFTGLTHTTYTIYVKDANDCMSTGSVTITTTSGAPDISSVESWNISPRDSLCSTFSGSITLMPNLSNLGMSPTFQWKTAADDTDIAGANLQTLTLTTIPAETTTYRLLARNVQTGCEATFDKTIWVFAPQEITSEPVGDDICINQAPITLEITASSVLARSYQWQSSTDGVAFENIDLQTHTSYTVSSTSPSNLFYRSRVSVLTDICLAVYSDVVQVNVFDLPTIASVVNVDRCGIGLVTLSAVANPATAEIEWWSLPAGGTLLETTPSGGGFTTPEISNNAYYHVQANNGLCVSAVRTQVEARVAPPHVIANTAGAGYYNQNVCQGKEIVAISHSFSGGATGGTIAWTDPLGGTTYPTGLYSATHLWISGTVANHATVGIYNWIITSVPPGGICLPDSENGSINVLQQPATITTTTGVFQVCENSTIQLSNTIAGGTWSSANDAIATVNSTGLVTGVPHAIEGQPARTVAITYTLSNGCSETVTVTVNPTPRTISANNICLNNQENQVSVNTGLAGGTWTINQLSNIAELTPHPSISTQATVKGNAVGTFTLTYTTAHNCTFTSSAVTVNPLPIISGGTEVSINSTLQLTSDGTSNNWTSANHLIATVDGNGLVLGVGAGTVAISYQSSTGCTGVHNVTVLSCPAIAAVTPPLPSAVSFCHRADVNLQMIDLAFFARSSETKLTWRKNNADVSIPAGLTYNPTTFVLSGNPSESGTFYWTVVTIDQPDGCEPASWQGGSITIYDSVQGGVINFDGSLPTVGKSVCEALTFGLLENTTSGSGGNPTATSTYQWQTSTDGGATFSNIPSANANQTYSAVVYPVGEVQFRRLYACATCLPAGAASNILIGTVNSLPPSIEFTTTDNTVCAGTPNGSITITHPTAGMEFRINGYDYQSSPSFANVSGTRTVGVRNLTTGCYRDASVSVTSTTAGTPTISTFAQINLCQAASGGTEIIIDPTANLGVLISPTFVWTRIETGGAETPLNSGTFTGSVNTSTGALTTNTNETGTFRYKLTVTNSNGCSEYGVQTVYVRQRFQSVIRLNHDSLHLCQNSALPPALQLTTNLGERPRTYQWQKFNLEPLASDWTDIAEAISPTFSTPTNLPSAGYYRVRVQDIDLLCPAVFSDSATVIVEALPAVPTATDGTRCGSGTVNLVAATTTPNAQILWYDNFGATTSLGTTESDEVWTTHQAITAPTSGQTPTSVRYYVEAKTAKGCVSSTRTPVYARAYAVPTLTLTNAATTRTQTRCQGDASLQIVHSYGGGASGFNTEIVWDISPTPPPISGAAGNFQTTNLATLGTYRWAVSTVGHAFCAAATDTGSITILAPPVATIESPETNTAHCNTVTLTATAEDDLDIFWQTAANGTETTLSNPLTITTVGTHNRWARARSEDGGCWGAAVPITVTVVTVNVATPNQTVREIQEGDCNGFGGFAALSAIATPAGSGPFTYQWFINETASNTGGTPILGATTASLIPPTNFTGDRWFYCEVTTPVCGTITSAVSGRHSITPLVQLSAITDWSTVHCLTDTRGNNLGIGSGTSTGIDAIRAALGTVTYGDATNTNPNEGAIAIIGTDANSHIRQVWSLPVFAVGCNKTTYNAHGAGDLNTTAPRRAACRKSTNTGLRTHIGVNGQPAGDLFSWCAVAMLADSLCPPPWRVPTCRDFVELDLALGGTGNNRSAVGTFVRSTYIATTHNGQSWFGSLTYDASYAGTLTNTPNRGTYWSQTLIAGGLNANSLRYNVDITTINNVGGASPRNTNVNWDGYLVRCIRTDTAKTIIFGGETTIFAGDNTTWLGGIATSGTWESSDTDIAAVGDDGVVAGIAPGTAVITYTVAGIGFATREIRVLPAEDILGCATTFPPIFTAGFASDTETTIGNQIWSAPVIASHCRKAMYDGGAAGAFTSDCRSNNFNLPAAHVTNGDLFSWCMVARFGEILCPAPWRVPTTEEFRVVNIAIINIPPATNITFPTIGNAYGSTAFRTKVLTNWNVPQWSSLSNANGTFPATANSTNYWSKSDIDEEPNNARSHIINSGAAASSIRPQASSSRALGFTLRCVRDRW